jgi:hypothetical protein
MFPVRFELNLYIIFRRNSVFRGSNWLLDIIAVISLTLLFSLYSRSLTTEHSLLNNVSASVILSTAILFLSYGLSFFLRFKT